MKDIVMRKCFLIILLALGGLLGTMPNQPQAGSVFLNAAGATFPSPLYRRWFAAYQARTGVRLTYTETGSGEGIRRLLNRTVDIGASDVFLTDAELAGLPGPVVHLPSCMGAVAIIYNLPGDPSLRLTPDLIARLFLGDITGWASPDIAAVNPDRRLPELPVRVVHRTESSGTTFLLSDFLTKTSSRWHQQVGRGKRIDWPLGIGTEGNPGVAEMVSRIPGSIGYVSLTYAASRHLPAALVRNRAGRFLPPTLATVSAAAAGVPIPDDTRVLFTDTLALGGYPISAFTYLIVHQEQAYDGRSFETARSLVAFLRWALNKGQHDAEPLFYAPLPPGVVALALTRLQKITYGGQPLCLD